MMLPPRLIGLFLKRNLRWVCNAAAAVVEAHPERALEIYRGCVDSNLTQASISAYETVAAYLKKMRPIL